jgi:hypothetical protein
MAQIVGREHTFYGTDDARVTYTCRISPSRLSGWAPAVLVDGISGADITADTTTFGASGFAPSGSTGGVEWFEVGDAVRLVEIGTVSPTASTQHTVTGVSGSVVTVSPSPSATFVGLAASPLKVMVIPDDWTAATTAQQLYAYLADTTYRLDAEHPRAGLRGVSHQQPPARTYSTAIRWTYDANTITSAPSQVVRAMHVRGIGNRARSHRRIAALSRPGDEDVREHGLQRDHRAAVPHADARGVHRRRRGAGRILGGHRVSRARGLPCGRPAPVGRGGARSRGGRAAGDCAGDESG